MTAFASSAAGDPHTSASDVAAADGDAAVTAAGREGPISPDPRATAAAAAASCHVSICAIGQKVSKCSSLKKTGNGGSEGQ